MSVQSTYEGALEEIDRLKKELAATRQESERWYAAFNAILRERDLLRKELAAQR